MEAPCCRPHWWSAARVAKCNQQAAPEGMSLRGPGSVVLRAFSQEGLQDHEPGLQKLAPVNELIHRLVLLAENAIAIATARITATVTGIAATIVYASTIAAFTITSAAAVTSSGAVASTITVAATGIATTTTSATATATAASSAAAIATLLS